MFTKEKPEIIGREKPKAEAAKPSEKQTKTPKAEASNEAARNKDKAYGGQGSTIH